MANILVFGDSIAAGFYDSEAGGWVSRLRAFLDKERDFSFSVYNLAISGDSSGFLLERFDLEAGSRLGEEETIIIFAIGINDSYFVHSSKGRLNPLEKFQENILKLIKMARKFSSKIVFVGLTPVDDSKIKPMPWDRDKSYDNKDVKEYDRALEEACKKEKIPFLEIFNGWVKTDYKKFLEDGAHPNSLGHKKIFEAVKEFLISKNII
jgi:lysophospholipase L1-like esterase